MTTAGCLPCRGVCHVVRPTSPNHTRKGYLSDLYDAFTNCLKASVGYRSIAIPAFCSDVLGLPLVDESRTMHRAVTDFCRRQDATSTVLDIHLVDTNETAVWLIQQEFDQSLSGHMPNAKTDKISQRSSGITTNRSYDVTSSGMNGMPANVGSSGRGSSSSNMGSGSVVTGTCSCYQG
ncbi:hypothetical protein LSAT2_002859 [Lamellibrachia satsuma]|nr:hypothetical protein LSAT2_002859 [Lamellibrachia satsuma]